MQLTGKQIVERNIISNYAEEGIQQQGLDVRVESISVVRGRGKVPVEGKTIKPMTVPLLLSENGKEWILMPGYYEVTLKEGCKIPSNIALNFKTRSSLVRCGAIVHSGQFDAGFETEKMGCFLEVFMPVVIERGARIAQAILNETYEVKSQDLYDGQWQNDIQREEENTEPVGEVNEVTQVVESEEPSSAPHASIKSKKRKRKN